MSQAGRSSKEICKDFAQGTSCHGLKQIYDTNKKWIQAIWIILILTVFGLLIWQVVDRFQAYFLYNTSKQTSQVFVDDLPFPAITICNYNRYFNLTPEEAVALNTLSFGYDYGDYSVASDTEAASRVNLEKAMQFFQDEKEDFNLTKFMISKSWPMNGYTVVVCTIGGNPEKCSLENFTPSYSGSLGQCWTMKTNLTQKKKGAKQGIELILNAQQDGYEEDFLFGRVQAGALFQVHPAYEPPQVNAVGQSVGVGMWATVSMQLHENANMYTPWGYCEPENEHLQHHSVYTVSACLQECYNEAVLVACGCRDITIRDGYEQWKECNATEVLLCAAPQRSRVEEEFSYLLCGCTPPCKETSYTTSISYSTFPNVIAADYFSQQNISLEDLRENYFGLSFYFDELKITRDVESKAISESALLSDIGGQLGLWMGVSVLTLFEFIQLLLRLWKFRSASHEMPIAPFALNDSQAIEISSLPEACF